MSLVLCDTLWNQAHDQVYAYTKDAHVRANNRMYMYTMCTLGGRACAWIPEPLT